MNTPCAHPLYSLAVDWEKSEIPAALPIDKLSGDGYNKAIYA